MIGAAVSDVDSIVRRARSRAVFVVALRRSSAFVALPVMLALVATHLALRSRSWTHEWRWSIYQLGFVTILLGPLLAGVAAWEGWRLSGAADLLATSPRRVRAAAVAWASTVFWGFAAFASGLLAVLVMVKAAGTPGWPSSADLVATLPPLGLLAAEAAVGLLAGWWIRHPLAAPAAALGCFLLSLSLYVSDSGQFITVGGVGGSMVNLAPRADVQSAQLFFYAAVAVLALPLTARARPGSRIRGPAAADATIGAGLLALVGATALLHGQSGLLLTPVHDPLTCVGRAPTVCVAPGYVADAVGARRALLPYLHRLAQAGVTVPTRFEQGGRSGRGTVGEIDAQLLLGAHADAGFAVLNSFFSKECAFSGGAELQREWSGVAAWLMAAGGKAALEDPQLPAIIRGPATPEQLAWIRNALADLSACGR